MQIQIKNKQTRLRLTKSELSVLQRAVDIMESIQKIDPGLEYEGLSAAFDRIADDGEYTFAPTKPF